MDIPEGELGRSVSYSEIYTYMDCPQKHEYAYNQRLRKNVYSQSSRMNIGTVVHELLADALNTYHNRNYEASLEDIFAAMEGFFDLYVSENRPQLTQFGDEYASWDNTEELAAWDNEAQTAFEIAKRTVKHIDVPNKWRTVEINWLGVQTPLIEWKFDYPLTENRNIVGKIDWVARNLEDGQVYLIDWKTRAKFTTDYELSGEDMNLQLSIYQHLLNSLGVESLATITYQIRSSLPSVPAITQGGKISKQKIASDYETVYNAIIRNGENPEDYADFLANIQREDYWWLPVTVYRSERELHSRWITAKQITERMVSDEVHPKYETAQCTFCPFFRLCLAEDRGFDVKYIIERDYTSSLTKPENSGIIQETNKEN